MSKNIYGKFRPAVKTNTGGVDLMLDSLEMVNTINEVSTDDTMAGNSDLAVPTEQAVKTYADTTVAAADEWLRTGTLIYPKTTGDTLGIDSISNEANTGSVDFPNDLKTDIIAESTATVGVTIDSVLLKDDQVTASDFIATTSVFSDVINEYGTGNGITLDVQTFIKDGTVDTPIVKTDLINEKTGSNGVVIDDLVVLNNIQQAFNRSFSNAGVISGGVVTDSGSGEVDISTCICYLRTTNSDTGEIRLFTVAGVTNVALTDNSENYIYIDYNAGTPQFAVTVTGSTVKDNENTLIELAEVYRATTVLTITPHCQYASNLGKRLQRFLYQMFSHIRVEGLVLGETGTREITVSQGIVWVKLNPINIGALDTSGTDTFDRWYDNNGTWTVQSAQTTWDELQWNDIPSGLTTMTNNRHSFQEFYILGDGKLISVYADAEYVALASAESAPVITSLPDIISEHSTYIGRLIFQKSGATTSIITNPFLVTPSFTSVTDHGNLSGLGDDDHVHYALLDGRNTNILKIDQIDEFNAGVGVTIDSLLIKDGRATNSTTGAPTADAELTNKLYVDTLDVFVRAGNIITPKSVNGILNIDNIYEESTGVGVTIEGVLLLSDDITAENASITTLLSVNGIVEYGSGVGVTIEGLKLEDAVISAPTITLKTTGGTGSIIMKDNADATVFEYSDNLDSFTFNDSITVTIGSKIVTNEIDNYNAVEGIDIEGTKFLTNNIACPGTLTIDTINEKGVGSGCTVEGCILKDSTITCNPTGADNGLIVQGNSAGDASIVLNKDATADKASLIFQDASNDKFTLRLYTNGNFQIYNTPLTASCFVADVSNNTIKMLPTYGHTVTSNVRNLFIDDAGIIGGISSTKESKMDINRIISSEWLYKIPIYEYRYRKKENGKYLDIPVTDEVHIGPMAREAYTVNPHTVYKDKEGKPVGINDRAFTYANTFQIQELKKEIAEMKKKIGWLYEKK